MGVKTDVVLDFGPVDQRRGSKHLLPGRLTEAVNVYQNKESVYVKRGGFPSYPRTADSGTVSTAEALGVAGGAPILRTANRVYSWDASAVTFKYKGDYLPVTPSWNQAMPTGYGEHPAHQIVGSNVWVIAHDRDGVPAYRVFNKDTLIEVQPLTPLTSVVVPGNIVYASSLVLTSGGNLFLLTAEKAIDGTGTTTIQARKFNTSSPSTAPASTTPLSGIASALEAFDVVALANGNILVGVGSGGSVVFGLINGTTGALASSSTYVSGYTTWTSPSAFIKNATGATAYWCGLAGNTTDTETVELTINTTTLAVTATVLETLNSVSESGCGALSGYLGQVGDRYYVLTNGRPGDLAYVEGERHSKIATAKRITRLAAGTTTIEDNWLRRYFQASEPFVFTDAAGRSYLVALFGHDDGQFLGQKSWVLLDIANRRALARARWGDAGSFGHQMAAAMPTYYGFTDRRRMLAHSYVSPVTVQGNKVTIAVNRMDTSSGIDYSTDLLTFDLDPSDLGAPVEYEGNLLFPGGWPMQLSPEHVLRDVALNNYPEIEVIAGGGPSNSLPAGTYTVAACYAMRFRDGRVLRSSPSIKKQVILGAPGSFTVSVPAPPLFNNAPSNLDVFVEFYAATVGTTVPVMLQKQELATAVDADGNVNAVFDVGATVISISEVLYTDGGSIDQEPPPAFKAGCYAKKRLWLTGTPTKETWVSREVLPGEAPGFNSELTLPIDGVTVGAVDDTYTAIITSAGAWVASGNGKNDAGQDGWDVRQLGTTMGASSPHCVSSPVGLFFIGLDRGIWLITRDLQVVYVGRGVDNERELSTVTGCAHFSEDQHVRFTTSLGKVLVFDYGRKPAAPADFVDSLGQWYVWEVPVAPVATANVGGRQWYVEANGTLRQYVPTQKYDGSNTFFGMRLKLPISFAGIPGYSRISRAVFSGNFLAPHRLRWTFTADGTADVHTKDVTAGPVAFDVRPMPAKAADWTVTIEEQQTGATYDTAAFEFEGIGFSVIAKPGLKRLGSSQRM